MGLEYKKTWPDQQKKGVRVLGLGRLNPHNLYFGMGWNPKLISLKVILPLKKCA